MYCLTRPWGHMHYSDSGAGNRPAVVVVNSLGADLRMWQGVAANLPALRVIGFDKRGHGLSSTPSLPWDIAGLADDLAALLDHLGLMRAVVAGCSIGGLIAQDFAARYPARTIALVLSNTSARIGTAESWRERIAAVQAGGMAAVTPAILERWFPAEFRARPEAALWATMLARCDTEGYIGSCGALARADLTAGLAQIAAPTLVIAGGHDGSTPADLVRAMAAQITGSRFVLMPESGHLPAIDNPQAFATLLTGFLQETGFV